MSWEVEQIGACTLYRGGCREVLPRLEGVDCVVTDPPYGINFEWDRKCKRRQHMPPARRFYSVGRQWAHAIYGDADSFDPTPWLQFPQGIFWGANHYASRLPDSNAWLIWDKRV